MSQRAAWPELRAAIALCVGLAGLGGSSAHAQSNIERLPILTTTSLHADRHHSQIVSSADSVSIVDLESEVSKLAAFDKTMVNVSPLRQVQARFLADHLRSQHVQRYPTQPVVDNLSGIDIYRNLLTNRISIGGLLRQGDAEWQLGQIHSAQRLWNIASSHPLFHSTQPLDESNRELGFELTRRMISSDLFSGRLHSALSRFRLLGMEAASNERDKLIAELNGHLKQLSWDRLDRSQFIIENNVGVSTDMALDLDHPLWTFSVHHNDFTAAEVRFTEISGTLLIDDGHSMTCVTTESGLVAWHRDSTELVQPSLQLGSHAPIYYRVSRPSSGSQIQSPLEAVDAVHDGTVIWSYADNEFATTGVPVSNERHVFIPQRNVPDNHTLLLSCLDASDGNPVWQTTVGTVLAPGGLLLTDNREQLVLSDGMIFWPIDGLCLCCFEETSGDLLWISGVQPTRDADPSQLGELIVHNNVAFMTTVNGIAAFDVFTGKLLWQQYLRQPPRHLLGLVDGRVISSSPGLTAINILTGQLEWRLQGDENAVKGVVIGENVLWPVDGELITVDSATGRMQQRDRFQQRTGRSIQQIARTDSLLILYEGDRLSAYRVDNSELRD